MFAVFFRLRRTHFLPWSQDFSVYRDARTFAQDQLRYP